MLVCFSVILRSRGNVEEIRGGKTKREHGTFEINKILVSRWRNEMKLSNDTDFIIELIFLLLRSAIWKRFQEEIVDEENSRNWRERERERGIRRI